MTLTALTTAQTDRAKIIMDKLAVLKPNTRDIAFIAVNSYFDGLITQERIVDQPPTTSQ